MKSEDLLSARLARAEQRIRILESMVENKTRELFVDQQRTQRSNEYLESIIEAMTSGVVVTDESLSVRIVNRVAAELFCRTKMEVQGSSIVQMIPGTWLKERVENQGAATLHGLYHEAVLADGDQSRIPVGITFSVLKGVAGEFQGIICTIDDLSERKQMERELLQAHKLESVGRLSSGIAHEINTPIQYVRDNTIFLKESLASIMNVVHEAVRVVGGVGAPTTESIEAMKSTLQELDVEYISTELPLAIAQTLDGTESVARIVRSLKEFSHPGSEKQSLADIGRAIESTVVVSRNEWKYLAELDIRISEGLPLVPCLIGEMNQVFLNLIVNAAHAIAEVTENGTRGQGRITVSATQVGDFVEVQIADTGAGIPDSIRHKIFDPFFTTKGVGRGTGQGLTMAYLTVVEKHKGTLTFDSEVGVGTTFRIMLPLVTAATQESAEA